MIFPFHSLGTNWKIQIKKNVSKAKTTDIITYIAQKIDFWEAENLLPVPKTLCIKILAEYSL